MNYVFDLVLLLIFIIIVTFSTIKGFIRSIWSTVAITGAAAISYTLGPKLGDFICAKFVFPYITVKIFGIIDSCLPVSDNTYNATDLLEMLPDKLVILAEKCGVNINAWSEKVVSDSLLIPERLHELAESFALPISKTISNTVGIILLFLTSLIILFLIGLCLKLIIKIPSLKSMDRTLGFFVGMIKGIIIISMLCFISALFVESAVVSSEIGIFFKNLTDNSYIFRFFCKFFPVSFINVD